MTDIIIDVQAFAAAVSAVTPILNPAVKIPAYQHLRFDLAGGRLTLSASDTDMEARAAIDAKGDDIAFLMPRPVADFIAARAGQAPEAATLSISDGARQIVAMHGRARIVQPGLPADDFVVFNAANATLKFTLRAGELSGLLKPVARSIPEDAPTAFWSHGAFLHPRGDELRAAGSDGKVMQIAAIALPEIDGEWPAGSNFNGLIVPKRTVDRIVAMVDGLENEVSIAASPGFLSVSCGDMKLFSRLIDAQWPDYDRIVTPRAEPSICVDAPALIRALRALDKLPSEKTGKFGPAQRGVTIAIGGDGAVLTMRGDVGEAEDFVPGEVKGEGTVTLGVRYLENAVAAAGEKRVVIAAGENWTTQRGSGWRIDGASGDGPFAIVSPRVR